MPPNATATHDNLEERALRKSTLAMKEMTSPRLSPSLKLFYFLLSFAVVVFLTLLTCWFLPILQGDRELYVGTNYSE